jgi:GNAT superfamily N-acetyltransferase
MIDIIFREATREDAPALAQIRGESSESREYWNNRILGYMNYTHHPHQSLHQRIIYVACADRSIIGFIAGHLTHRYNCDGELQWINVIEDYTRRGIASKLIQILANWFVKQDAYKICVDPGDDAARHFYRVNGAVSLNRHWMFWPDIRRIIT